MKGTSWYTSVKAYYDIDLTAPYGDTGLVDVGDMVNIIARTDADPEVQRVKFTRTDSNGNVATLWAERKSKEYGRKLGTVFPHCVEIINHGKLDTSPYTGEECLGQVMVTISSYLYSDLACTNVKRAVVPGELIQWDTEQSNVIRSFYEEDNITYKCYFKRELPLAFQIYTGVAYDQFILAGTSKDTQEKLWAQVAIHGGTVPPPPPPPQEVKPTWQKVADWCLKYPILAWFGKILYALFEKKQ